MPRYVVKEAWTSLYKDPMVLHQGQTVTVDRVRSAKETEWEGWIWCRSADNEGWIPAQILDMEPNSEKAVLQEDYSARELDAHPGDVVTMEAVMNGWMWCRRETDGESGWLPLRILVRE